MIRVKPIICDYYYEEFIELIRKAKSDFIATSNYSSGKRKIVIKGTSNAAIDVYNVNGMLVARINGSSVQSEVELSSKGVYLVRINEGGKSVVLKVIY